MEAPEKIYIDDFGSELSYNWHTEHCYEKDIEYVRIDTFMKRACEYFAPHISDNSGGYERTRIIEDFKKYMEK